MGALFHVYMNFNCFESSLNSLTFVGSSSGSYKYRLLFKSEVLHCFRNLRNVT